MFSHPEQLDGPLLDSLQYVSALGFEFLFFFAVCTEEFQLYTVFQVCASVLWFSGQLVKETAYPASAEGRRSFTRYL